MTTAYISMVVKGDRFVAGKAASARRIPFSFVCETRHNETVGRVGVEYAEDVRNWFDERIAQTNPGDLLLFSVHAE